MSLNMNKKNRQIVQSEMMLLIGAKDTAMKDIETLIKSTHEQLEQRKNDLTNHLLDEFNARQKALLDKQQQIEEADRILNENIIRAKRITKTTDLNKLKPISESLRKINEKTKAISSNLDLGENYFVFDSNKGLDELSTVGQIYTKGFLPSRIAFRNTEATAGHKAVLTVEVYNHHGDKVPVSSGSLSLQITDTTGTKLQTLFCITSSECTLTFTPQMSGLHKISGFFLGQELISEQTHISVSSNNPVLKFGVPGGGNGTFNMPWGIAIDHKNCIYVADTDNRLIQKFTAAGKFLTQFSVAVHNKDHTTCDIALDHDQGLILCPEISEDDYVLHETSNILVFDMEGKLHHTYTLDNGRTAFFIAIDWHGNLILSREDQKECLFKVDKEGNFLTSLGNSFYPGYIAIGDDDSMIVPDEYNDCVYIFNADGTVRHKFGSTGKGNGQLKQPLGVATDGEYILVSEKGNTRVQVFDSNGSFISIIESTGDPLHSPCGLAVTADGYVYVVDTGNCCIKKYKYRDVSWWQVLPRD